MTLKEKLETFKKDYLNYYGIEYILNEYEIKKYNSLSEEEKNMISYIFNYCSDNDLFGKIVPRLSLFFKAKFRFDELRRYCRENRLYFRRFLYRKWIYRRKKRANR